MTRSLDMRKARGQEFPLEPGERELGSYMDGALAYSWLMAATVVLVLAMVVGLILSKDGKAGVAVATSLSGNMMLFAALGKRRLTLTNQRLVLKRSKKDITSVALADISSIDVRGTRVGRISIAARRGKGLKASVFGPLNAAAEIQAACAAASQPGNETQQGGSK